MKEIKATIQLIKNNIEVMEKTLDTEKQLLQNIEEYLEDRDA